MKIQRQRIVRHQERRIGKAPRRIDRPMTQEWENALGDRMLLEAIGPYWAWKVMTLADHPVYQSRKGD